MKCGLLGRKLSHSYSPLIHGKLADYSYDLTEKEPEELDAFFDSFDYDALNVTVPYKETVMKYCARISPEAEKIGSVNTLVRKDGKLYGYNTDYYGFGILLDRVCVDIRGKKVLVLGSGGTSKTAVAVIRGRGGIPTVVPHRENTPENIAKYFSDTEVLVNTTPVGMYPNTLEAPVELEKFEKVEAVIDVIYNPSKTKLLLDAERLRIPHVNGLYMLVAQAERACSLFKGEDITCPKTSDIVSFVREKTENIVFLGMPGCGKSTVGKISAEKLGREFVDCDEEVEIRTGRTPSQIIREDGEETFRKIETEVLRDICKRSSLVVSTGGGCVTVEKNRDILRQNSVVVLINRSLSELATSDRPLSKDPETLRKMYQTRNPLYKSFSDVSVDNSESAEKTAEDAIQSVGEFLSRKKRILVINGPNLNLLGVREPEVYGSETYEDLKKRIYARAEILNAEVEIFQSNGEGAIIDKIHEAFLEKKTDGIVINPAGYTHTSVAILDALKAVKIPTVEVHISDISSREDFRKFSYVSLVAQKTVCGKGFAGYEEALTYLCG